MSNTTEIKFTTDQVFEAFNDAANEIADHIGASDSELQRLMSGIAAVLRTVLNGVGSEHTRQAVVDAAWAVVDGRLEGYPDTGPRDACNLQVNAALTWLEEAPKATLEDVAIICYSEPLETVVGWIGD